MSIKKYILAPFIDMVTVSMKPTIDEIIEHLNDIRQRLTRNEANGTELANDVAMLKRWVDQTQYQMHLTDGASAFWCAYCGHVCRLSDLEEVDTQGKPRRWQCPKCEHTFRSDQPINEGG